MTSIFAELPPEIKMIIYKNYLQKQIDFHIERFKNKDTLVNYIYYENYIKVIDDLNEKFNIFTELIGVPFNSIMYIKITQKKKIIMNIINE